MRRLSTLLLEAALLLSAVVAVIYLVRILPSWFLPIQWYWGGALAALAGPALVAAALRLIDGRALSAEAMSRG